MRLAAKLFAVTAINEYSHAPRRDPAIDVAPAVADHEAPRQVNLHLSRGVQQHPRRGLYEIRGLIPSIITDLDPIDRKGVAYMPVHLFNNRLALRPAPHVGLIGGDDEEKLCFLQKPAHFVDLRQEFELGER